MSSPLQIDLRPSRLLRVALCLLAVLASLALWLSEAARWMLLAVPAVLLLAWPRAVDAGHVRLLLHPDGAVTGIDRGGDESAVAIEALQWRGPLCVLTVIDVRQRCRYLLTPETLSAVQRRQLRLWFDRFQPDASTPGAAAHV
jgi:hypothetical protein